MNIFESDFQNKWEGLFGDIVKLNDHTSTKPIQLKNVKVLDFDLEGAIFNGAEFENIEWKNITAEYSKYRKTKFKKCKFINSKFLSAEFTDVVFENCEFINTSFLKSTMINVLIISCKSVESEFDSLVGTELFVKSSDFLARSSFTDSKIPLNFQDTRLSGVNMMGMIGIFSLLIEGGSLDEVNFSKSHFSNVVLRRVTQDEGPTRFNDVVADTILFEDVNMSRGVSLAFVTVKNVRIQGGTFRGATEGSKIAELTARDSILPLFDMSESQMTFVSLSNCEMYDIALWDCFVDEYSVVNSSIHTIRGKNFKADTVLWDNVTLSGKIDLTNAQVKDFRPTRIQRSPDLQLVTTGSNMKF